jgi:serine protease Do
MRDGKEQAIELKLASLPNEKTAAAGAAEDKESSVTFGLSLAPAASVQGAGKQGVVVTEVDENGAGAEQGLRKGDVILEIAGKSVTDPADVKKAIDAARKDGKKTVLMRIKTGESARFVALAFPKA